MEIPVISGMAEFEASINSLNNPSLISRFISTFDLHFLNLSLPFQFCKWSALFLSLLFAYRINTFLLHLHTNRSKSLLSSSSNPLLSPADDDDDDCISSSDEQDDDVCSSSDHDREEEEEDLNRFYDDFQVKGSFGNLRTNFSLSDLVGGNGVVRLWENTIPAVSISPAVIFTAGEDGRFGLGLRDLRVDWEKPVVQADWRSDRRGRVVGVDAGGTGKVYVREEVRMAVGDIRKVEVPIEKLTAFEDKWWDVNGVITAAESKNEFAGL